MASGKKLYFRHSLFATDDEKIQAIIDDLGFEGYGYYFSLLELLYRQCQDEVVNPIRIHQQSVRSLWRKQSKSCNKVITKLEQSGVFVATFSGHFIEFDMPNTAKYLGKYTAKISEVAPKVKKSKVKKRKEVESVVKVSPAPAFDLESAYELYPLKKGKSKGIAKLQKDITSLEQYKKLTRAIENYAAMCKAENKEPRFIKHFSTFAGEWEDFADIERPKTQEEIFKEIFKKPAGVLSLEEAEEKFYAGN